VLVRKKNHDFQFGHVAVRVYTRGNLPGQIGVFQMYYTQFAPAPDLVRFFITFFACFVSLLAICMSGLSPIPFSRETVPLHAYPSHKAPCTFNLECWLPLRLHSAEVL
jgi:hypothetical protein